MSIDDPDHEVPPAGRAQKHFRTATGCIFMVAILVFLTWFIISNRDRTEGGSLFGFQPWTQLGDGQLMNAAASFGSGTDPWRHPSALDTAGVSTRYHPERGDIPCSA